MDHGAHAILTRAGKLHNFFDLLAVREMHWRACCVRSQLAREIARQAEARGLQVRVCVAATRIAATLLAAGQMHSRSAVVRAGSGPNPGAWSLEPVVIPRGAEAAALAPLPLDALLAIDDLIGPALEKAAAGAPKRSRRRGQVRHYRLAPAPQIPTSPDHHITRSRD